MERYSFDDITPPLRVEVTPTGRESDPDGGLEETYRGGIFDRAEDLVTEASEEAVKNMFRLIWTMARNTGWLIEDLQQHPEQASLSGVSVDFGLGFSGEGNVFITRLSANTSIKVSIRWDAKET